MATKKLLKQLVDMTPLNILGLEYDIVLHPKRWLSSGSPGTVVFPHAKIYLDTSLSDDRIIEILFHEIMEVVLDRFTIREISHIGICALEFGVMDVLRHNPKFRKAIGTACMGTRGNTYDFSDFEENKGAEIKADPKEEVFKDFPTERKKKKVSRKNREKQEVEIVEPVSTG